MKNFETIQNGFYIITAPVMKKLAMNLLNVKHQGKSSSKLVLHL